MISSQTFEPAADSVEDKCSNLLMLPSCIESLASSASQLKQLATETEQYYIKKLFTYYAYKDLTQIPLDVDENSDATSKQGREAKPTDAEQAKATSKELLMTQLTGDNANLKRLDTVVSILPFLGDISAHYEKCFATVDSTLRRMAYYIGKSTNTKTVSDLMARDEFNLPKSARIDAILVSWMELVYGLVSLDNIIRTRCNIFDDLEYFQSVCKAAIAAQSSPNSNCIDLASISTKQLNDLREFIATIQLTICDPNQTLFQECISRLKTLSLSSTVGFQPLCGLMAEFITFYCTDMIDPFALGSSTGLLRDTTSQLINLNLIPTAHMGSQSARLFGICSMYIFYSWLTTEVDQSVTKSFLASIQLVRAACRKVQFIGSSGYLEMSAFIKCHLNQQASVAKALKHLEASAVSSKSKSLDVDLAKQHDQFAESLMAWLVQFKNIIVMLEKSQVPTNTSNGELDFTRVNLLLSSILNLTDNISFLVKSTLVNDDATISRASHVILLKLVSMLKLVEQTVSEHRVVLYRYLSRMQSASKQSWTKIIEASRKRFLSLKYSDRPMNMPTFIVLSDICHQLEPLITSDHGRTILTLCLSMLLASFGDRELQELELQLVQLGLSLDFFSKLAKNTDCRFVYWLLPAMSVYYGHFFEDNFSDLHDCKRIHSALDDMRNLFVSDDKIIQVDDSTSSDLFDSRRHLVLDQLEADISDQFKTEVLDRLCQELEIELRLQTHRQIQVDYLNPFKRQFYNFKSLLSTPNKDLVFRIFNRRISLQHYVERYLNRVSYNLTALAGQDWPVYEEMANLASQKFNLKLNGSSQLPDQAAECDYNLSQVIGNLPQFVARYSYDQLDQTFIEKHTAGGVGLASANSFNSINDSMSISSAVVHHPHHHQQSSLNVIKLDQVSRWIASNGFGVVNGAANSIYQTMKLLISVLTKQLQDDQLRNLMEREKQRLTRQQAAHSAALSIPVTFDQASKLARKYRHKTTKRGHTGSASSRQDSKSVDLDTLRQSITQIGNLWGLLRLLTNGSIDCAAKTVQYFPDQLDIQQQQQQQRDCFVNLIRLDMTDELNSDNHELESAATLLDQCITDTVASYSPKINIEAVIYDVFRLFFQSKETASEDKSSHGDQAGQQQQQKHFQLFHLIVPALVVAFVDHLVHCKDRVSARIASVRFCPTLLTDDGFAMGLAFLLATMGQTKDFAKLCWFEHVVETLDEDRKEIEAKLNDPSVEDSLKQTSNMTLRRLTRLGEEYAAAQYTVSGAQVFFQGLESVARCRHGHE